jgi:farnesyl-diphosphate farnesyltransferase
MERDKYFLCRPILCFNAAIMQELLKQVSRSFYLTLHILPRSIRSQLSLAYLLARASDTVVDTQLVDCGRRRNALLQIRKSIRDSCEGLAPRIPDFGEFASAQKALEGQGTPAERVLLEKLGELLAVLRSFSAEDRVRIRNVLDTITHGQELDLIRFGEASAGSIAALADDEELDAYTYQVAGCVGEFWTHMCRAHVFPKARMEDARLIAAGVRFGKGLQMVNILRDLPRDLHQGRCYIPEQPLSQYGLRPRDLLDEKTIGRFRPLLNRYLLQAEEHLAAGWRYTEALPFWHVRIRLACCWPILIGMQTLEKLRRDNVLDSGLHIHISQSDTRRLILRSIILYPNPKAWSGLFNPANSRALK